MKKIEIPIKQQRDGSLWLHLSDGLDTKGFFFRAVKINKDKKQVLDFDGHHCDQASASGGVRCKPKSYYISDKVFKNNKK